MLLANRSCCHTHTGREGEREDGGDRKGRRDNKAEREIWEEVETWRAGGGRVQVQLTEGDRGGWGGGRIFAIYCYSIVSFCILTSVNIQTITQSFFFFFKY